MSCGFLKQELQSRVNGRKSQPHLRTSQQQTLTFLARSNRKVANMRKRASPGLSVRQPVCNNSKTSEWNFKKIDTGELH